jgi:CheY-like chemotaxis protein
MMSIGEKLLVADDDGDLVEKARIVLKTNEHQINTANEPQIGLSKAHTDCPALLLVDVMMPTGTEGFHSVWKIRNLPEEYFRNVPIITPGAAGRVRHRGYRTVAGDSASENSVAFPERSRNTVPRPEPDAEGDQTSLETPRDRTLRRARSPAHLQHL